MEQQQHPAHKIAELYIDVNTSIISAIEQMDEIGKKLLIVMAGSKYRSLLSIGDIQRALIAKHDYQAPISNILRERSKIRVAKPNTPKDEVENLMLQYRMEYIPVIDKNNNVSDVIFWNDTIKNKIRIAGNKINIPVVIMAGGKGTRLKPFTNIIPKPLLPFGDKTIIDNIIDRFYKNGSRDYYISVNYKAALIKNHFKASEERAYRIHYIEETKPLGTAGSLRLLKNMIRGTFILTNCDIIIDQDYGEIYNYHKKNKNDLTLVSVIKRISIPYGTIKTTEQGLLESIEEKPELIFQMNSGLYFLEDHLLNDIPVDSKYDMTELIEHMKEKAGRIGVFPVSDKSWTDIGNWQEYFKILELPI